MPPPAATLKINAKNARVDANPDPDFCGGGTGVVAAVLLAFLASVFSEELLVVDIVFFSPCFSWTVVTGLLVFWLVAAAVTGFFASVLFSTGLLAGAGLLGSARLVSTLLVVALVSALAEELLVTVVETASVDFSVGLLVEVVLLVSDFATFFVSIGFFSDGLLLLLLVLFFLPDGFR